MSGGWGWRGAGGGGRDGWDNCFLSGNEVRCLDYVGHYA